MSILDDLVEVVNSSATVNTAQLVGTQDGKVIVPCYDWSSFLGKYMNKAPKMKSYHHFTFSSDSPGIVTLKQYSDSVSTTFSILKNSEWVPSAQDLPPTIPPSGLSNNRLWYLYRQIREFCREGTEDQTCPKPALPPPEELPRVEQRHWRQSRLPKRQKDLARDDVGSVGKQATPAAHAHLRCTKYLLKTHI